MVDGALRNTTVNKTRAACAHGVHNLSYVEKYICIFHIILPSTQPLQFSWTVLFKALGLYWIILYRWYYETQNYSKGIVYSLSYIFFFIKTHGRNSFQISTSGMFLLNHWFVFIFHSDSRIDSPLCVGCQVTCRQICNPLSENAPTVTEGL